MTSWILDLIRSTTYFGLGLLTLVETVFPPIPSELIIPLGGYLARQGDLSIWGVALASGAGSTAGAVALYFLGKRWGARKLHGWVDRHGRWLAVSTDELERARNWFDRHGGRAVFIGRLIPGLRSIVSIPAGIQKMPFAAFLGFTVAGSLLWSGLLAGAGYALGAGYDQVDRLLDPLGWIVFVVVVGLYIWRVVRHRSVRKT
jgi:membrane protein DedA with SNARE-associated domain